MREAPPTFDVAVVGAGPAGAALAIAVAREGMSVVLLDRPRKSRAIGETLPAQTQRPLAQLGAWAAFGASGPLESLGVEAAWGGREIEQRPSILDPYGCGWHIDRLAFDALLVKAAQSAGAQVMRVDRLTSCALVMPRGWCIDVATAAGSERIRADLLVDASGRGSGWCSGRAARRIAADSLVAVAAFVRARGSVRFAPTTLVESAPEGWWYSAPVPSGEWVVAYFTDARLLKSGKRAACAAWRRALDDTDHTRKRAEAWHMPDTVHVYPANGSRLAPAAGPDWIAVGDAALVCDPLSGQGIYRALDSGLTAARAIAQGTDAALYGYEARCVETFANYQTLRRGYYAREQRWRDSPFWRMQAR